MKKVKERAKQSGGQEVLKRGSLAYQTSELPSCQYPPKKSNGHKGLTGFTLAEVLITLVIIGVVAALTIPTLNKGNRRIETEAQLKKVYSTLANGIKLSMLENGDIHTWNYSLDNAAFFNTYIYPYFKTNQTCTASAPCSPHYWKAPAGNNTSRYVGEDGVVLSDGTYIRGEKGSADCPANIMGCALFFVDINGVKGPNTLGKDVFWLTVYDYGKVSSEGLLQGTPAVLSTAINLCKTETTSPNGGLYCTAWIMSNGWKIPDDYPWL